jgi:hypothetical protein
MSVTRIVTVVDGHGEVSALPVLLRRIAYWLTPQSVLDIPRPYRLPRQNLIASGGIEDAVTVAIAGARDLACGRTGILVMIDADDDCPCELGSRLLKRIRLARPDIASAVVLANRDFEAWFLAAASSLGGCRGLPQGLQPLLDPEKPRDCKGWLTAHREDGHPYRPVSDQAALAAAIDLNLARENSPSFAKLVRDVERLLQQGG